MDNENIKPLKQIGYKTLSKTLVLIHNPEVTGSTPVLATKTKTPNTNVLGVF